MPFARMHTIVHKTLELTFREPAILIVDPSPVVCTELIRELRTAKRRAIFVPTPLEAVDCLRRSSTLIDVVYLAPELGHFDATEFATYLAEEMPSVRVVLKRPELAEVLRTKKPKRAR